jgi:hypothetical protein
MTDPMSDFRRAVFEDIIQSVFTKIQNFVSGSTQTDFVLDGDPSDIVNDVPFVWVNGVRKLQTDVSWVDANTVRLADAPGLGKNVKILVGIGGNSGYLLRSGTLAMTGDLDMGGNIIKNCGVGSEDDDVAIRDELDFSGLSAIYLTKAGGTMTGTLAMGTHKITGGAAGVDPTDFVIKSQLPSAGYVVGDEKFWAGPANTVPTDWEIETGQMKDQTTDAALFAVLGHTYDTSTVTGKFFMPDPRGRFIRILGDGTTTIDKDGANRINGSNQAEDVGPHTHPSPWDTFGGAGEDQGWFGHRSTNGAPLSSDVIKANTGKETRPVNQARYLIMKVR